MRTNSNIFLIEIQRVFMQLKTSIVRIMVPTFLSLNDKKKISDR